MSVNKIDKRVIYYFFEIEGGGKNKNGDKSGYGFYSIKGRFIYDANTGNIKFEKVRTVNRSSKETVGLEPSIYSTTEFADVSSSYRFYSVKYYPNSDSPKNITSLFINFRVRKIIASSVGIEYKGFDRYFYAKENPDYKPNVGNPWIKAKLYKIREENKDLYDQGRFDVLFEKYNEGLTGGKFGDVATLVKYYNYYDQPEKIFQKSQYYIKEKLNQIREENQEAYDSGNFEVILEKYNEVNFPKFFDVDQLLRHYKFYDNYPNLPESILDPRNEDLKFTKVKNHYFEFDMRGSEKAFSNRYEEQTFMDVIKNKYYEYFQ